jgi:hypothetical protein
VKFSEYYQEMVNSTEIIRALTANVSQNEEQIRPTAESWDTSYDSEFGPFSAGEMFACWVAHDNLHIRQLVELQRAHIERITQTHNILYAGDW